MPPAGEAQSLSHWTTREVQDCGLISAYQSSKKGDLSWQRREVIQAGQMARVTGNEPSELGLGRELKEGPRCQVQGLCRF